MPRIPRLAIYSGFTVLSTTALLVSAHVSRPNFYSAAVAVGRSSGAMMVLANCGVWLAVLFGMGIKGIFFGTLRSVEYEHLFERLWIFLTESLLALTIFRDDFSAPFAIMYGVLVFLKCFHWITSDRVDYIDQVPPPGPRPLFHVRMVSIIMLLTFTDLLLVTYSLDTILTDGVSAMVLFASEFMILLAAIWGVSARYVVQVIDTRRANGREDAPSWEAKSMWMFYIDLAVDFTKLLTYLVFFTVILLHYGVPLHILRDVWMTFRSFISRCSDLIRYRRATRDMDALYPNATEEDVGRLGDRVCIICREEMVVQGSTEGAGTGPADGGPNETPKKLVCGHVFHFHCLRSWLERQQSCPTCRRDVLHTPAPNLRNVRNAAPPPPAPGAVPQPPQNNGNAHAPPLTPAEAFREQWNQYFRLPQENGAIPLPPPAPAHAAAPATAVPNGVHAPTPTTAPSSAPVIAAAEVDVSAQRSIWGGPIEIGRFFPPPLGAAPRLSSHAGPSRLPIAITPPLARSAPSRIATPPAPSTDDRPTANEDSSTTRNGSLAPDPLDPTSGSSTPFSSNPPDIFRSSSHPQHEQPTESSEGTTPPSSDNAARRAAADAAMRRLGLLQKTAEIRPAPATALDTPLLSSDVNGKGKGKEVGAEPLITLDAAAAPQYFTPYLSSHAPGLLANPTHLARSPPWASSPTANSADGSSGALEERLKVLRGVDEVVWGLISELTRVKSQWEAEDHSRGESTSEQASSTESHL